MSLLTSLQQNSLILNSKGGKYYATSYSSNLDLYAGVSRFNSDEDIILNEFTYNNKI